VRIKYAQMRSCHSNKYSQGVYLTIIYVNNVISPWS